MMKLLPLGQAHVTDINVSAISDNSGFNDVNNIVLFKSVCLNLCFTQANCLDCFLYWSYLKSMPLLSQGCKNSLGKHHIKVLSCTKITSGHTSRSIPWQTNAAELSEELEFLKVIRYLSKNFSLCI